MKLSLKHIAILVTASLCSAACQRFDPEDRVVTTLDFERCLMPVQVKTEIKYNTVTLDLKVFNDAEQYILELYKTDFDTESEPLSPEGPVEKKVIYAYEIPYTFSTLEDMTLYYRIAAANETEGKKQSLWATGQFTTSVDPTTICLTPVPEVKECFELVKFNWQKAETDKYLLEVYNNSIPAESEPDPADLYKTIELTNDDIPYSEKFPVKTGNYYFRAKAIDLAGERKDSKWAKGSFMTEAYSWPVSDKAINENYVGSYSGTCQTELKALLTGANFSAVDTVCYKKIYYMKECYLLGGDRMSTKGVAGKYTTDYGVEIPVDKRFIFFYIVQPGNFSAILRKGNGGKGTIVLLTNKKGEGKKAVYLFDSDQISTSKGDPTSVDVTEEMLYGITEPAQVILFNSQKSVGLQVYPITWTPWTPE